MVLTDEWNQQTYPMASLEDGGTVNTEDDYYSINTNAIVSNPASLPSTYQNNNGNPPYNNNPTSNTTATSAKMYKLNGNTGDKTGLGITLKVMSGDNVSIFGKSFWHNNGSVNNGYGINVNDLLTSLAGTNAVASAGKGITAAALTSSPTIPGGVTNWLNTAPSTGSNPKAYLNWILFDEQFKPVSTGSNFDPVGNTDVLKTHSQNVSIGKNGYLYVYCSNESNTDVFFDNLQVVHTKGALVEETHYYPFGLTMSGISSTSVGGIENKAKANGGAELQDKEFSDGSGLEIYDATFRSYDAQIGRFHQIDPLSEAADGHSPFSFVANNPISFADPLGLTDSTKVPGFPNSTTGAANLPNVTVTNNIMRTSQAPAMLMGLPAFVEPPPLTIVPPSPPLTVVPPVEPLAPVIEMYPTTPPNPSPWWALGGVALRTAGVIVASVWPLSISPGQGVVPHPFGPDPFVGNGNDRQNTDPHIVYKFTFTPKDTRTPVLKYGISDVYRYVYERPEAQIASLTARFGPTVKYQILTRTVNRSHALFIEAGLVSQHKAIWGEMPRAQIRPGGF